MKVKYLLFLGVVLCACLGLSCVCAADNVSAVNVSDNVSGNISEANVSETNVFAVSSRPDIWDEHYETQIEVNPYYLSGSDGDIINFTARVYFSGCVGYAAITPIYGNGQCFGGGVSLHEDGKLIDSVILSKDNNGAAFFSFKFKEGHRYHLKYHSYGHFTNGFCERSYIYEGSSKNLSIAIVSALNVSDNVSGNISETNVSADVSCSDYWTEYYETQIEVNPYYLSGYDGDIINFTARVCYSKYLEYDGITPIFVNVQCFGGRVSLHEDGKLIDSVILSKDNNGLAFFSFKYKAGRRYHLEYHGYSSPDHGFLDYVLGNSYYYKPSSEDLNIAIVSAVNVTDNVTSPGFWSLGIITRVLVDPPKLSASDGDIINFTARVYYIRYVGFNVGLNGIYPIYDKSQCFESSVSLYEDGKRINTVMLSKDNDGAAFFSFKFKAGHRYRLVYHGYNSPHYGFRAQNHGASYHYMPSSKDLKITIVR